MEYFLSNPPTPTLTLEPKPKCFQHIAKKQQQILEFQYIEYKPQSLVYVKFHACPAFSKLMSFTRAVLGKRVFAMVLRPFVYAQFVAGETESEIAVSMEKMNSQGLHPMLAVPIEEDLGESSG